MFLLGAGLVAAAGASAQEVSPRTYSNTPTGVNFLGVGYTYSEGDLEFDGALEVEAAEGSLHTGFARYVRAFDVFGRTAKLKVALPYVDGKWQGKVGGMGRRREVSGFGDLRVTGEWLFYGAEAQPLEAFERKEESTLAGASLTVIAPTGKYQDDLAINLGSNRWTLRPEIGIAHQRGPWTFELAGTVWLYGDNDDFVGGNRLEQDAFWAGYAATIYEFRPGIWVSAGVGYGKGARTAVNGVDRDTLQENWRFALIGSYAITKGQGISLVFTTGTNRGVGYEPTTITLGYQLAIPWP